MCIRLVRTQLVASAASAIQDIQEMERTVKVELISYLPGLIHIFKTFNPIWTGGGGAKCPPHEGFC